MSEMAKWAAARMSMMAVEEFLDWCDENGLELATRDGYRLYPHYEDRQKILDRHFGIDAVKLENERRALLDACSGDQE
jgi:hypothetical protein